MIQNRQYSIQCTSSSSSSTRNSSQQFDQPESMIQMLTAYSDLLPEYALTILAMLAVLTVIVTIWEYQRCILIWRSFMNASILLTPWIKGWSYSCANRPFCRVCSVVQAVWTSSMSLDVIPETNAPTFWYSWYGGWILSLLNCLSDPTSHYCWRTGSVRGVPRLVSGASSCICRNSFTSGTTSRCSDACSGCGLCDGGNACGSSHDPPSNSAL